MSQPLIFMLVLSLTFWWTADGCASQEDATHSDRIEITTQPIKGQPRSTQFLRSRGIWHGVAVVVFVASLVVGGILYANTGKVSALVWVAAIGAVLSITSFLIGNGCAHECAPVLEEYEGPARLSFGPIAIRSMLILAYYASNVILLIIYLFFVGLGTSLVIGIISNEICDPAMALGSYLLGAIIALTACLLAQFWIDFIPQYPGDHALITGAWKPKATGARFVHAPE
jgi:hypothetical protein